MLSGNLKDQNNTGKYLVSSLSISILSYHHHDYHHHNYHHKAGAGNSTMTDLFRSDLLNDQEQNDRSNRIHAFFFLSQRSN